MLLGLYALREQTCDKRTLAFEAIHIEQDLLHEAVGSQDQACAAYGGFNRINFLTDGSIEVNRLLAPQSRLAELESHLALYFTGFARTASEVAQEQLRVTPERKAELSAMLQLVSEAEEIVTNSNRSLDDFGRLLHENWKIKRTLTQKITNASIDQIYEAGLNAGALGGKLLGAGAGGFMLFYVPPERREALRLRLKKLLCVPFSFSSKGSHVAIYEPEQVYDQSLASERDAIYAPDPEGVVRSAG
jgi:D-glycero-alpha-D-manno-heptose-7-phosphate kinase